MSAKTTFRSRLVKVSIVGIPAILIVVWAAMVFLNAPRAYPAIAARHVTTFLLNKEGKNREVAVFEFIVTNWKKFEFDLKLQSVTQKDGNVQRFWVDLPRQELAYSWGSFYWKSRFYVVATQDGSVALLNHTPQRSELEKLDYISPFRTGELPDNSFYSWRLKNNNAPMKRALFAPDTRSMLPSPGGGVSFLQCFNDEFKSEVSFWIKRPLPESEKVSGHCDNPNCTVCRCDDPDCDRCRKTEPNPLVSE